MILAGHLTLTITRLLERQTLCCLGQMLGCNLPAKPRPALVVFGGIFNRRWTL